MRAKQFLKDFFMGHIPLFKVFWLYHFLVNLVFIVTLKFLSAPDFFNVEFSRLIPLYVLAVIHKGASIIAIYKSTKNYTGRKIWKYLAYIYSGYIVIDIIYGITVGTPLNGKVVSVIEIILASSIFMGIYWILGKIVFLAFKKEIRTELGYSACVVLGIITRRLIIQTLP